MFSKHTNSIPFQSLLASLEISTYVLSFLFFLQRGQSSWKHSRILWRNMGGGVSLSLAKSFFSFSNCFSYSFESDAFFGWKDIFLPTFALLYIRSRIPILVVLEFSRETGCYGRRIGKPLCDFGGGLLYLFPSPLGRKGRIAPLSSAIVGHPSESHTENNAPNSHPSGNSWRM